MKTVGGERAEILVLRAWVEVDGDERLRVRATRTISDGTAKATSLATASIDGVCALVRSWLEELLRGQPQPPGPDHGGSRPPSVTPG